mgnify:CR=1 FL=1
MACRRPLSAESLQRHLNLVRRVDRDADAFAVANPLQRSQRNALAHLSMKGGQVHVREARRQVPNRLAGFSRVHDRSLCDNFVSAQWLERNTFVTDFAIESLLRCANLGRPCCGCRITDRVCIPLSYRPTGDGRFFLLLLRQYSLDSLARSATKSSH